MEEFLWDKRNKEPIEIKKYMAQFLREKLLDDENPNEYKKGISYVTLDRLDFYAEYATKVLLDKIYFYDYFHPELLIKNGFFSDLNSSKINEFYIPIDLNIIIDGHNYIDNINLDILNKELIPENIAEIIVKDQKLNKSFIVPISFQIRRGIHCYIYDLFKNLANNYEKYIGEEKLLIEEKQIKITRNSDDIKKHIPTFLFDSKLSKLLGKKRNLNYNKKEEYSLLPSFLKNKKKEKKIIIDYKESKNTSKLNKKIDKKKAKKINLIEHDKQSTTVEEFEEKEAI